MPFEPGQRVSDYEILDVLGKGGMGRVYRVRNVISNRIEAMKVLLADFAGEAELGDRFAGEIRTLARLDHQNIGKLHTAIKVDNQLVMVMEFVEGFTLTDRAKQGPIPLQEVLSYMTQTLAALGYAHENGVVHRDIKPSNIMVTPHGIVKLMDFGIAKSNTDTMHTRAGTTMGSMLYMSPEQVRGTTVDARSDLYSMGVVLYELTAGRRPFESESTYAVLEAQLNATPQPPLELNPSLPKPLNDIIMTALEKEPMRRFQSAEAFRKALESLKAPQPAAAAARPAASLPATMPIPARSGSNRAIWMAAGAIACVLVLIAAAIAIPHFSKGKAASTTVAHQIEKANNQLPQVPSSNPQTDSSPAPAIQQPANQSQSAPISEVKVQQNGPRNAPANGVNRPVRSLQSQVIASAPPGGNTSAPTSLPPAQATAPPPVQAPVVQPAGPSQADIEKVQESLMQLHARADAIKGSVDNLRRQQAADGLGLSPEIAGAATRLDQYLQAADRASQSNDLAAAQRYMDNAEKQLGVLEAKFGR